jgi:hypothetical protein
MNRLPKALDDKDFTPGSVWECGYFFFQSVFRVKIHQNDVFLFLKNYF